MINTTPTILAVHVFYHARNLRVLPIPVGMKCPIEKGWPSSQKRADDIEAELQDDRYDKYGWLLDDCHLVVDIDVHDPSASGFDALNKLESELGYTLADVCDAIVETPSGGRHYYFTKPADAKFGKVFSSTYPGVDFIHGRGKQVIAANSANDKHDGAYTMRGGGDLLEAPKSMLTHLQSIRPTTAKSATPEPHGERSGDDFQKSSRGLQLIVGELAGRGYEIRQCDGFYEFDRPGKQSDAGRSGFVGKQSKAGNYQLTCFSASDAYFPHGESMTIFHSYALLCCGGDHRRAAAALFEHDFAMQSMADVDIGGILDDPRYHAPKDIVPTREWKTPTPLPAELSPVLPFEEWLLPESVAPFVVDVAERMQCPIEFPSVGIMVALAGVIGRKIGVRPKRQDDWTVIPNLWGMIIGRPGVMKTPALDEPLKFLKRLEIEAKNRFDEEEKQFAVAELLGEARKKNLKRVLEQAVKTGKDCPEDIAVQMLEEDSKQPTRRRFVCNDTTVEKLGEILNENGNGITIVRDEIYAFLKTLDKEGHEAARGFYLEAWNGSGRYTYVSVRRGYDFLCC